MSTDGINKWHICRICLKDEHKKLYNIFDDITEQQIPDLDKLPEKIETFGGIKLYQQNNLPTKICNRCVLLLRAALKFYDLCQQSQNQLKQFINVQKEEVDDENDDTNIDSDTEVEIHEIDENVEMQDQNTGGDGFIVEERIDSQSVGDGQDSITVNNNEAGGEFTPLIQHEEEDFVSQSDDEDDDNSQYVVEEVNAKQFECEDIEEEITTYKYEEDPQNENIIIEEQSRKTEPRKILLKKNEKPKRKRKISEDAVSRNRTYNCPFCDNTYTDRSTYNMHIKIHSKEKPHECEICCKRFSTTPQLSRHMNSHTGNRPYKCKFCDSRFGDPSTKIKHERIHTNERPYKCNLCDKAFAYSNVLKVHMMTHTGEKPYSCDFCSKSFSQQHHKNAHEKKHNNIQMVIIGDSQDIEYMVEDDEEIKEEDYKAEQEEELKEQYKVEEIL